MYDESGVVGMMYKLNNASFVRYYYQRNLQGDVIALYTENGTRMAEYAYDAWGNCSVIYGASTDLAKSNPIRYRGYYYDRETGLYYLNARYYNPQWRRFISPDDTAYIDTASVNGLNLYCYCNNDPVNYADPSGHLVITMSTILIAAAIGIAVGVTAGGIAGAAVAACNDTNIWAGFAFGAVGGAIMGIGAGIGALFLPGVAIAGGVTISIAGGATVLSAGAAVATGLIIAGATGMIGGAVMDLGNQLVNNNMNWRKVDCGSVVFSAVEYGALNMIGAGLGGLMGADLPVLVNLLGSKMLNVIPTGWGFVVDVLRGQL